MSIFTSCTSSEENIIIVLTLTYGVSHEWASKWIHNNIIYYF